MGFSYLLISVAQRKKMYIVTLITYERNFFFSFCLQMSSLLRLEKGNFYNQVPWKQTLNQRLVYGKLISESSWTQPLRKGGEGSRTEQREAEL